MPIAFYGTLFAAWSMIGPNGWCAPPGPNILIAISDDQSWPHASAYGSRMVHTPAFDRIAREGILFHNACCASPGCSPSRAALLTGLNTWQLQHAGTHASYFPPDLETFPDRLEQAGYFVGYTGKGWGPGDFEPLGRTQNPAGPQFKAATSQRDDAYVSAFQQFLQQRSPNQPFCFWFGSSDPHRSYSAGSGLAQGKRLVDAEVPPFLPDTEAIRSDLLDYAVEVERFDRDLAGFLRVLEEFGELDRTLIIVTSDNGMPFPRAKANCYEFGIHMPLAMRWGDHLPPGRASHDLVSFTDLTATIYDATQVAAPTNLPPEGRSLLPGLRDADHPPVRDALFAARERHSSVRFNSLGYPQRCIRTREYLYIINFTPERWPAGAPQKYDEVKYDANGQPLTATLGAPHGGYHDIDASPTLSYLVAHRDTPEIQRYLQLAVGHRPEFELFHLPTDPGCLQNLADTPGHAAVRQQLHARLWDYLQSTHDARVTGQGDIWETYPRVSNLRWFPTPDWVTGPKAHVPVQDWLEARRPK